MEFTTYSHSGGRHEGPDWRAQPGLLVLSHIQVKKKKFKKVGFPADSDRKESTCNARDLGSVSWDEKIPWRKEWQPTPVFLPGESPWTEELGRLQSMGLQGVRDN